MKKFLQRLHCSLYLPRLHLHGAVTAAGTPVALSLMFWAVETDTTEVGAAAQVTKEATTKTATPRIIIGIVKAERRTKNKAPFRGLYVSRAVKTTMTTWSSFQARYGMSAR